MNNNYEFSSKKYIFLIITICIMFIIFIVKVLDYMPEKVNYIESDSYNSTEYVNSINKPSQSEVADKEKETAQAEQEDPDKHKSGHIDFFKPNTAEKESENTLVEIDTPSGVKEEKLPVVNDGNSSQISNNESSLNLILNAKKLKKNKDYTNALSDFQKAADIADSDELKAICFESIAEIYAINRKFGSALTFANKAYQLSPSDSREMLIAKIYFQSGQTDNAITRVNSVLRKSFK